jgi:peptidoglycan/LPS O-acetylase OafA/YrhL
MKLKYRPEIDGLRAIAILLVVFYHSQINLFKQKPFQGGFIGVDIFFVISGYLISSIILKELVLTDSFSIKNFYQRRIRRILPPLFLVMILSFPFAWLYLLPTSFVDFSKSGLLSLSFVSNYYFHFTGLIYGTLDGFYKPFLHTWSLSLEEQFYIFYPILLICILKYFKNNLIYILLLIFFISLISAQLTSQNYPSTSFYFLHTRIWQLLAGSILAFFEIKNGYRSLNKTQNKLFPLIGIILILYSVIFFRKNIIHPSFYTLIPVIGTCLIIWFSNKDEIITRILSSKLFVGIGLISYSLYLIHYPIFAFVKTTGFATGDSVKKLLLIPLIIVISVLSYYFVEKPARNKNIKFKKILIYLSIAITTIVIANFLVVYNDGYKERFLKYKTYNQNYNPDNLFLGKEKMQTTKINLNFSKNNENILIIGDSHGQDLFNSLNLNRSLFKNINFFYTDNKLEKSRFLNETFLKNAKMIIFSSRWDNDNFDSLKKNIGNIKKFNSNIAITSRTNEYKVFNDLYTLLDQKIIFEKIKFDYFSLKKEYFDNRVIHAESDINRRLKKLAQDEELTFLNKEDYMCNIIKGECFYVDQKGNKLFYDYGHYTKNGAEYFGKLIYDQNWLGLN